ncbi:MAG: hypothetical protein AB7S77_07125 [Desulfatirhabdiaceae bacterium]
MAQHCDFTLQQFRDNLPLAFSQVTSETCRKLVAKVVAEEDKYWEEDGQIDKNQGIDISLLTEEEDFKKKLSIKSYEKCYSLLT